MTPGSQSCLAPPAFGTCALKEPSHLSRCHRMTPHLERQEEPDVTTTQTGSGSCGAEGLAGLLRGHRRQRGAWEGRCPHILATPWHTSLPL